LMINNEEIRQAKVALNVTLLLTSLIKYKKRIS
jgi:hypothetical protein